MSDNSEIIIAPSLVDYDTYFIYRDNGKEVKVNIKNNMIYPDYQLTIEEVNHIRKNILKIGYKPANQKTTA
jgi:hypothetical protein